MENVDRLIEFVKQQEEFQSRMARKYLGTGYREALHRNAVKRFQELLSLLEGLKAESDSDQRQAAISQKPPASRQRVMLTLDDINGIPAELLAELNLSDTDRQELLIEKIIADAGGVLSLDKILIALYRTTGSVVKRATVLARLYRMANRGLIYTLPSKKGLYSTFEMSKDDVRRLFGQLDDSDDEGQGPIALAGSQS